MIKTYISFLAIIITLTACGHKAEKLYSAKPGFYAYASGPINSNGISAEHYSKVYATPASCQKVITALLALKTLGPDYKFQTSLLAVKKQNKIQDIIIKFSGDPTLSLDQLVELCGVLRNTKINGHIFIDASAFGVLPYSHKLVIEDIGKAYCAPVGSVNIDRNIITANIYPGRIGGLAQIKLICNYPLNSGVATNHDKTSVILTWLDGVIHAAGNINIDQKVLELKIAPQNHDQYILHKIKALLASLNINGKVKIIKDAQQIPQQAKLINTHFSLPLVQIMQLAMASSDNLVFDSIYLSMIQQKSAAKITHWENGNDIIHQLLKVHFNIDAGNAIFVDGSGLSRYNKIQPSVLFELLKKGFYVQHFLDLLPKPGQENSTLKNRLNLASTIRAKTGNMSGISCLCGYNLVSFHPTAFVVMANSFAAPSRELFSLMDNFVSQ